MLSVKNGVAICCGQVLPRRLSDDSYRYFPEYVADEYIRNGRLMAVLTEWCPWFEGYHIFYPHRRQDSPAFMAFLQVLRNRYNNRIR
ncbi:LysR substrate-binding domain-containing protein [Klebsiella variicola]|uniref:LysR substrate-binding domain-containing protein n=1 Tax=Klebsiella variicola TaxID=244366 RepID=UPI002AC91743|nr:LysR substrate-binding domain-containing protein [Klebsiella variicola]